MSEGSYLRRLLCKSCCCSVISLWLSEGEPAILACKDVRGNFESVPLWAALWDRDITDTSKVYLQMEKIQEVTNLCPFPGTFQQLLFWFVLTFVSFSQFYTRSASSLPGLIFRLLLSNICLAGSRAALLSSWTVCRCYYFCGFNFLCFVLPGGDKACHFSDIKKLLAGLFGSDTSREIERCQQVLRGEQLKAHLAVILHPSDFAKWGLVFFFILIALNKSQERCIVNS